MLANFPPMRIRGADRNRYKRREQSTDARETALSQLKPKSLVSAWVSFFWTLA